MRPGRISGPPCCQPPAHTPQRLIQRGDVGGQQLTAFPRQAQRGQQPARDDGTVDRGAYISACLRCQATSVAGVTGKTSAQRLRGMSRQARRARPGQRPRNVRAADVKVRSGTPPGRMPSRSASDASAGRAATVSSGKSAVGAPPDPLRTDETRRDSRAVHRLGDLAGRGHRSGAAPVGSDLAGGTPVVKVLACSLCPSPRSQARPPADGRGCRPAHRPHEPPCWRGVAAPRSRAGGPVLRHPSQVRAEHQDG